MIKAQSKTSRWAIAVLAIFTVANLAAYFVLNKPDNTKYIEDLAADAPVESTETLEEMKTQIFYAFAKANETGETLNIVIDVEKGSIFDQVGIRPKDIISSRDQTSNTDLVEKFHRLLQDRRERK